ncbi:hypothetical protein ACFFMN_24085 [Planobispora siamensis]|uniref:Transposase n=1 Tax=Planobispora siamensis TaxID=936338 RepID=A0A8J3WNU2_9ACTN|nr:hypothetical protein [Planobispora siamensis]GIH97729.1 hypothetical protein Psi01_83590 [Planobispora siamensis]
MQSSSLVRIRRTRARERPPILLPQQVQAILDGCAIFDEAAGEWRGNLRDRMLFALPAESESFSGGRSVDCSQILTFVQLIGCWTRQQRPRQV